MKVYIDNQVYRVLDEFYDASMRKHITLDYQTIIEKIDRLEKALYDFADFAECFQRQPYRKDWQKAGYRQKIGVNPTISPTKEGKPKVQKCRKCKAKKLVKWQKSRKEIEYKTKPDNLTCVRGYRD